MIRLLIRDRRGMRQSNLPGWALGLSLVAGAALAGTILVVGIGLALLLAPVVIVGGLILRHKLRKAVAEMEARLNEARRQTEGDVIDADYRVVDDERRRP
jgi:predicted RND superfamily exporter protein